MHNTISQPPHACQHLVLTGSEGDIVRAMRSWIIEAYRKGALPKEPKGDDGAPPIALHRFLSHLTKHSRRALQFASGHNRSITADEQSILNMIAAAQQENTAHAHALRLWLVASDTALEMDALAEKLGHALASRGMVVPHRLSAPPARRDSPGMIALPFVGKKTRAQA